MDGVVLDGKSAVGESMVTGESMPTPKGPADKVTGGTVNGTGSLVIRAEKVGAGTVLARIVAMVAEAQHSRAPIQRIADTVAGYFVPPVLAIAIASFVAWAVWGPSPAFAYAYRGGGRCHHRLPVRARCFEAYRNIPPAVAAMRAFWAPSRYNRQP